jgi:hypothetical protein
MSLLVPIILDMKQAERDFLEFQPFIQSRQFFSETEVVTLLKGMPHLCCLVLFMMFGAPAANAYKFEFQIEGMFKADLVVGNTTSNEFVLVEFEGGEADSLFGPSSTLQVRDWSRQIGHGFGQLIDWGWALDDNSKALRNAFGCDDRKAQFILVCGRSNDLNKTEQSRLDWRTEHVILRGRPSACLTYDGLLNFFKQPLW